MWVSVFESLPEWLKTFLLNKATKRERVGVGGRGRERERERERVKMTHNYFSF